MAAARSFAASCPSAAAARARAAAVLDLLRCITDRMSVPWSVRGTYRLSSYRLSRTCLCAAFLSLVASLSSSMNFCSTPTSAVVRIASLDRSDSEIDSSTAAYICPSNAAARCVLGKSRAGGSVDAAADQPVGSSLTRSIASIEGADVTDDVPDMTLAASEAASPKANASLFALASVNMSVMDCRRFVRGSGKLVLRLEDLRANRPPWLAALFSLPSTAPVLPHCAAAAKQLLPGSLFAGAAATESANEKLSDVLPSLALIAIAYCYLSTAAVFE